MDINKVQKLNDMALNLKRHNIVYSKEDALQQAENIYGSDNDFSHETVPQHENELDDLRKEVRKLSFAMQNLLGDMKDVKMKTVQLEKELNDARVGQRRVADIPSVADYEAPKKDLSKPIDRNNIAPSDVSVEKFFYFGQR